MWWNFVNMPQATFEEERTIDVPAGSGTGTTGTSSSTKPSGPGTLRQRFKLTVDDISKEVEELSVKLKRKVRRVPFLGQKTMRSSLIDDREMGVTR